MGNDRAIPPEFTLEHIKANTEGLAPEQRLYESFWASGQPFRSLAEHNKHMSAKFGFSLDRRHVREHKATFGLDLHDDAVYYNTQGSAKKYWEGKDLPKPTKDIHRLRHDLKEWGYCLVEEALSPEQTARMQRRVYDQLEGERLAGLAMPVHSKRTQDIHMLLNKGLQFRQMVEHDPEGVQAGPLIERLLTEAVGPGFIAQSFHAIVAHQWNLPQALHQDNGLSGIQINESPTTCNTIYMVDEMTSENGGTLVIPGSHKLVSVVGSGQPVREPLPPAINLEAPAGTALIFEGRLLHGTGVNRTPRPRTVLVMNATPPFYRQQENFLISADPSWLVTASAKLLYRIGATAGVPGQGPLNWVEGCQGQLVAQRLALERGEYVRVGELSPTSTEEELARDYTVRRSDLARALAHRGGLRGALEVVRQRFGALPQPDWKPQGEFDAVGEGKLARWFKAREQHPRAKL